jgi:membrane protease YdiL (CAAX protease family)
MDRRVFLSIFISSFLFLAGSYLSAYLHKDASLLSSPLFAVFLLVSAIAAYFLNGGKNSAIAFLIFSVFYFLISQLPAIQTLFLHISLLSIAIYFLWDGRSKLITGCGSMKKRVAYGFLIFFILLGAAVAANVLIYFTGLGDQIKVQQVVSALPLYIILLTFTIGPFSEELFFRALLVPKIGVPLSTILFMLTHIAYGSISELAGAFFLGFVLANAYYYLKDPLPVIIAHGLFNLLAVIVMLWVL